MEPELFFGALLVILGAGLGYASARYQGAVERREFRRTLATALLSELRWLEGIVRQVHEHGPASYYDPLEHPVTTTAISNLALFASDVAERIVNFHNMLRDLRAGVNRYREAPEAVGERRDEYRRFIRAKALFTARAVPGLRDALLSAGGRMPPPIVELPIEGSAIPQLPEPAFESYANPDRRAQPQ